MDSQRESSTRKKLYYAVKRITRSWPPYTREKRPLLKTFYLATAFELPEDQNTEIAHEIREDEAEALKAILEVLTANFPDYEFEKMPYPNYNPDGR